MHPLSLQVVEVVLAVSALTKGLFTVVASSLLGSILSNLLLVMGECKPTQSIGLHAVALQLSLGSRWRDQVSPGSDS